MHLELLGGLVNLLLLVALPSTDVFEAGLRNVFAFEKADTWAEYDSAYQTSKSGGHVHNSRAGKVVESGDLEPASAPYPVGHDGVHHGGDEEGEDDVRIEHASLCKRA